MPRCQYLFVLLLFVCMMQDMLLGVSALLIPSQLKRSSHNNHNSYDGEIYTAQDNKLIPSQVIHNSLVRRKSTIIRQFNKSLETEEMNGDPKEEKLMTIMEPQTNNVMRPTSSGRKQKIKNEFRNYGNIPDTQWRAIPMDHLRSHPRFQPLQHPDEIKRLHQIEDVRYFRQDSWQWDELHIGRCTTSQATPALGFLEPHAAKFLGVPRSLQKGCSQAFYRLSSPAIRSLDDMNRILCTGGNGGDKKIPNVWKLMHEDGKPVTHRYHNYPFIAKYIPFLTREDLEYRRNKSKNIMSNLISPMGVRMSWGNQQEATAILTALNYFSKLDNRLVIKEVGMCGAGLDLNCTIANGGSSLLIGASPDAVIEYSNGTLEALEVKNHCPFVPTEWTRGTKSSNISRPTEKFKIRELPLQSSVPAIYFPQLQMEMLCLGKNCRSAIMVRQTATCGSILLRIHRNNEWIDEMLYWLRRFVTDYVEKQIEPPQNFFWDGDESERYQKFVQLTRKLSEQVDVVAEIENGKIQRVLGEKGMKLPLFLD